MNPRVVSKCVADNCSAANPTVVDINLNYFPDNIQDILKSRKIDGRFRRCLYCGTIWSERYIVGPGKQVTKIGTRELGTDNNFWFIKEGNG